MADPKDGSTQDEVEQSGASNNATKGAAIAPDLESPDSERLAASDIERLLDQASESLEQATGEKPAASPAAKPFTLGDLKPRQEGQQRQPINLLGEVEMDLRIELGRTLMRLDEVLQLRSGSVVALDKLAGDPVDVYVNGRLIARGEVLVMNDNFCIRVTELVGV